MFDGYGFVSRLRVQDGRAWGNQRYVQSKAFQAYKAQGEAAWRLA
jgi:carotenoid cleavage dioxygenase-like enzyme